MGDHEFETLVYFPFIEQSADLSGWDKSTVHYVLNNKVKVLNQIRAIARTMRRTLLQPADAEDIFIDVLEYLYKCSDYDISKAISRTNSDGVVSLEGYLNSCIKFCVLRKCTNMNKVDRETVSEVIMDGDNKEISIFNNIADSASSMQMDDIFYNLSDLCESCECIRYKYGLDIYLVVFIRLLVFNRDIELYFFILDSIGIPKSKIVNLKHFDSDTNLVLAFSKAISRIQVDEALKTLRRYVYSADTIELAVGRIIEIYEKEQRGKD